MVLGKLVLFVALYFQVSIPAFNIISFVYVRLSACYVPQRVPFLRVIQRSLICIPRHPQVSFARLIHRSATSQNINCVFNAYVAVLEDPVIRGLW